MIEPCVLKNKDLTKRSRALLLPSMNPLLIQNKKHPFTGCHLFCFKWSGRRDSNSRPFPWQGNALPLSHFRILCFAFPHFLRKMTFVILLAKLASTEPLPHILSAIRHCEQRSCVAIQVLILLRSTKYSLQ